MCIDFDLIFPQSNDPRSSTQQLLFESNQLKHFESRYVTPFENPQRWMGQNTFPILLLNNDNMIEEH